MNKFLKEIPSNLTKRIIKAGWSNKKHQATNDYVGAY